MSNYLRILLFLSIFNTTASAALAAPNEVVLNYLCARAIASSVVDLESKSLQADYIDNGEVYCKVNHDEIDVIFRMANKKVRGGGCLLLS